MSDRSNGNNKADAGFLCSSVFVFQSYSILFNGYTQMGKVGQLSGQLFDDVMHLIFVLYYWYHP